MADQPNDTNKPGNTPPGGNPPPPGGTGARPDSMQDAVRGLSDLYIAGAQNGVSSQVTDAVTQALLLILGSGPSIAAFDSLLAVQASNGLMYHNAVAHQQKTNLLGMAMTAKCVRYMLDPASADGLDESIVNEEMGL